MEVITSLREEGVERVIATAHRLVRRHLSIRLDAMFKAVELPAGITDLDTSLTNVDGNALTLQEQRSMSHELSRYKCRLDKVEHHFREHVSKYDTGNDTRE